MQLDITEGPSKRPVIFRMNDNGMGPELLQQVFLERGWTEYDEEVHSPDEWHLWWRTTRFRTGEYNNLFPWQHINHFPSCTLITKKDALCRNLRKMKIIHGLNIYNFSPKAFNLPNDYTKFVSEYAAHRQKVKKDDTPTMWICKPAESSRGRGIFIFHELSDLQYDCNAVVQHYIDDPLLIGGYKFDIRIYVAIPSFHPLQIYIHEEGLVRFSTEKYDLGRVDNVFAHLTNTSINKFSPGYTTDKEEVGHGCKWTISQLRRYFLQNNIDDTRIWQQIINIIVLTVLMQAPTAPKMINCFELYGFDILIDSSLKAWLLEVNFSPALSSDCQADIVAKKSMLHDLMTLIQIPETDYDQAYNSIAARHHFGSDLDTARTVASTASLASPCSGMSSIRGSNGYSKLSTNSHSSDSHHRGLKGKHPSGSVAKSKINGHSSTSLHAMNNPRRLSSNDNPPKTTPKGSSSNCSLSEESPSSSRSGKVAVQKSVSLPYLNGLTKDENHSNRSKRASLENGQLLEDGDGDNNGENDVFEYSQNNNSSTNKINDEPVINETSDSRVTSRVEIPPIVICNKDDRNKNRTDNNNYNFGALTTLNGFHINDKDEEMYGEEEGSYRVKIVKGNMKGQGLKKVMSPAPIVKQNKVTSLAMARRQGKQSTSEDSLRKTDQSVPHQQQNQQHHRNSVPSFTDLSSNPRYSIPRNFSRLETSRFPYPHHHARPSNVTPGKNGTAPLSKLPQKQVGRLFLVFPFNEATQKLSTGNLDPKLIIKEILKQDAKNRKAADGKSSPCMNSSETIWSSMRSV